VAAACDQEEAGERDRHKKQQERRRIEEHAESWKRAGRQDRRANSAHQIGEAEQFDGLPALAGVFAGIRDRAANHGRPSHHQVKQANQCH
jgi:hypothetical protein